MISYATKATLIRRMNVYEKINIPTQIKSTLKKTKTKINLNTFIIFCMTCKSIFYYEIDNVFLQVDSFYKQHATNNLTL